MRERERQRHKNQCQKIGEKGITSPTYFPQPTFGPSLSRLKNFNSGKRRVFGETIPTVTETETRRYRDLIYPAIMKDKVITPSHLFFQPKDKINDEE